MLFCGRIIFSHHRVKKSRAQAGKLAANSHSNNIAAIHVNFNSKPNYRQVSYNRSWTPFIDIEPRKSCSMVSSVFSNTYTLSCVFEQKGSF